MRGEHRKDRRKEVRLKAGRRKLAAGEMDVRTRLTRDAMAKAGEALVRDERKWPALEAVAERLGRSLSTVSRHTDALDAARRLYNELVARHPTWVDPEEAGGETAGDAGGGDPAGRQLDPAAEGDGSGDPAPVRAHADADPVDGGPASREAGMEAALKIAELRLTRLEAELKAERASHGESRAELARARAVIDNLLKGLRPRVPEYKPLRDDVDFLEDEEG
jgi:hypothetical protein